jgi:hypothetical protein
VGLWLRCEFVRCSHWYEVLIAVPIPEAANWHVYVTIPIAKFANLACR